MSEGLVLLAGAGESTCILARALSSRFPLKGVILEKPVPRSAFLKRRAKNLGWGTVAGQIAFQAVLAPLLRLEARKRLDAIKREYSLDSGRVDDDLFIRIDSVNSDAAREKLAALDPAVVVINGTRIISRATLACVPAIFVNMHAGITPLFRGVHGGYWALAEGLPDRCGVTVHRVDAGIDTGAIFAQQTIRSQPGDNFVTYPFLQLGEGLRLLESLLPGLLEGRPPGTLPAPEGESRLWSHPTLAGYLFRRIRYGIK